MAASLSVKGLGELSQARLDGPRLSHLPSSKSLTGMGLNEL
jgi:hypothetical protein